MANRTKLTQKRKREFIELLRKTLNVSEACKALGISRTTAYEHRQSDEAFAAEWAEVEEEIGDNLEREAYRRAVEGVDEPVFYQGVLCGHVRKYSDGLLTTLLKANRAAKFKDRQEITGKDSGPIQYEDISDSERAARVAELLELARTRRDAALAGDGPADMATTTGTADSSLPE